MCHQSWFICWGIGCLALKNWILPLSEWSCACLASPLPIWFTDFLIKSGYEEGTRGIWLKRECYWPSYSICCTISATPISGWGSSSNFSSCWADTAAFCSGSCSSWKSPASTSAYRGHPRKLPWTTLFTSRKSVFKRRAGYIRASRRCSRLTNTISEHLN